MRADPGVPSCPVMSQLSYLCCPGWPRPGPEILAGASPALTFFRHRSLEHIGPTSRIKDQLLKCFMESVLEESWIFLRCWLCFHCAACVLFRELLYNSDQVHNNPGCVRPDACVRYPGTWVRPGSAPALSLIRYHPHLVFATCNQSPLISFKQEKIIVLCAGLCKYLQGLIEVDCNLMARR